MKNFFGSLDHGWLLQFVQHRVGDPRLISLIRRWLKAGVLEEGVVTPSDMGTPQGGSISVLLSNVYLHYALDLWFERVAKPRLRGEAYLVRYIDDFVVCFQFREDALRLQEALRKRLGKFGLTLEPTKTKLVDRFTDLLRVGSWLYIGHSESLLGSHPRLKLAGRTIYRRTA